MANDEDLARLRQGSLTQIAAWNAWRAQNPDRCVDLSRADLSEIYLGASWPLGDYRGGVHDGANLSRADLRGANLYSSDLLEADLSPARTSAGRTSALRTSLGRT